MHGCAWAYWLALLVSSSSAVERRPLRCSRFHIPDAYTEEQAGAFNPSVHYHHEHGWMGILRHDKCWGGCRWNTKTRPLIVHYGNGSEPALHAPADIQLWDFDANACKRWLNQAQCSVEDFRLFTFQGRLYAGHAVLVQRSDDNFLDWNILEIRQAVSWLDFSKRELVLSSIFESPKAARFEKNWLWMQYHSKLLMVYSSTPCLQVYQASVAANGSLEGVLTAYSEAQCYTAMLQNGRDSRGSSMPVQLSEDTYLFMVHIQGENGYQHWGVKMFLQSDAASLTHITDGPLVKAVDYRLDGHGEDILVVGSATIIHGDSLLVTFGEGDKYSCSEKFRLSQVVWSQLSHR